MNRRKYNKGYFYWSLLVGGKTRLPAAEILILSIGLIVLIFPLSCAEDQDNNTIRFWHSFVASTHPAIDQLILKYESQNNDVKIIAQYVPTGDALIQKLVTAIKSNTIPDIAWVHVDFFDKLVESNSIYSINELFEMYGQPDKTVLDDIYPELLRPVTYNNVLYALPMEATTLALLYNKSLFSKAGLDPNVPPGNWEELTAFTRYLTRDNDNDGRTDVYGFYVPVFPASGPLNIWMVLQWTPFLWQAGGQIMNETQTAVTFQQDAGVAALQLWKTLYDDMDFRNFTIAHDVGFISQKLAMILDGPWNLPKYRDINDFDWGVAPLPAGPMNRLTYISGEYLVIFRQSRHPGQSFNFINWLIEPEIQANFSMNSGYLPVRKSVQELTKYRNYLKQDAALKQFTRQISLARGRLPARKNSMLINNHIAEAIERSIIGNMDPRQALKESAEKSNALLQLD